MTAATTDNNTTRFGNRSFQTSNAQDKKCQRIAGRCQDAFFDLLLPLIRELFEHADDDMYALAKKSETEIVETQYFAAMRQLRKLQDTIESTFESHLRRTFSQFWIANNVMSAEECDFKVDSISLVQDDELEEQLAIDGLIAKSENRFALELQSIDARFSKLAGVEAIVPTQNPVSPYHFAEAFRLSLRAWDGDIGLRLVMLKLFDRHAMSYIGGVYDAINDILIDEGVLPELKRKVKKNPVAPCIKRFIQGKAASSRMSTEVTAEIKALSKDTFDAISLMLAKRQEGLGYEPYSALLPRPVGYEQYPEVSPQEFADALTSLQGLIAEEPPAKKSDVKEKNGEYIAFLSRLLSLSASEESSKRLAEYDAMLIDAIGMLFDFLLDEHELPDQIKALIARLQFPLIKAAKLDFSFFGNKEHPARRLLNSIGHAVFGWNDDSERFSQLLYARVQEAVARIVAEFVDDIEVFRSVNEEFEGFLCEQAEFARKAEDRAKQVVRGQEELLLARRRVAEVIDELNRKVGKLPASVLDFELNAWFDVLMLALLRDGEQSERWDQHLSALKLLIWSGLPKNDSEQRQKLLKTIPRLLKKLRAGLREIGFDMNQAGELFSGLKACHRAILSGKDDVPRLAAAAVGAEEPETGNLNAAAAPSDQSIKLQEVGDWLMWQDDGVSYRGKLAWRSAITGTCIFVNRDGMKIAEMSSDKMSGLIADDKASVMHGTARPLMDDLLATMQIALGR
jgi:hypothetical protein